MSEKFKNEHGVNLNIYLNNYTNVTKILNFEEGN